ncbi:sigma-70 family RNA polymerase sigma factor [Caldithrix abyssi]|uniref:RNA polymerase sigma factor n=1 Tax=Caldithrix abyssi DSM 13497 TaxID=880073 RepID=H1XX72_CALAY|nr:sigma-70 family RNA polymerase sigma factor [Caldithrix abyssi]APF20690.1 RNA polymerase sigma-70 factor, ECF subfamily [Caldithrix abyssi DSM 13497]EHO40809.1 RNA polymerase, sigma-24 subunit, ECF subfamily [Caldithrix abyssi DSM 13497]
MVQKKKRADYELVKKAKAGDGRAYDQLMEMYHDAVFNIILRMVHNRQEAEDLTQETFIKAYNSINSFNEEYAFSTWLFKIATNHCIDFFRKRKLVTYSMDEPIKYKDDEIAHEYADSDPTVDKKMVDGEKSNIIKQAIEQLPDKYRMAIILRHHEEKSYEEIAEILNLPLGTVKARIFRAREMLKKILKDALF